MPDDDEALKPKVTSVHMEMLQSGRRFERERIIVILKAFEHRTKLDMSEVINEILRLTK